MVISDSFSFPFPFLFSVFKKSLGLEIFSFSSSKTKNKICSFLLQLNSSIWHPSNTEMLVVEDLYQEAVVNTPRKMIVFNGELDRIRSGCILFVDMQFDWVFY
jgi:hypothetical protein